MQYIAQVHKYERMKRYVGEKNSIKPKVLTAKVNRNQNDFDISNQ